MKLENIFQNYKKEDSQDLMNEEWDKPVNQKLKKIQNAQRCKIRCKPYLI